MARIAEIPAAPVIIKARGVLDFACWRGLPYVRTWPYTPRSHLTPATLSKAADFGRIAHEIIQSASQYMLDAQAAVQGTKWTWRDYLTSAALGNLITWDSVEP